MTVSELLLIFTAIIVFAIIFLLVELFVPKYHPNSGAITWSISAIIFVLALGLYAFIG